MTNEFPPNNFLFFISLRMTIKYQILITVILINFLKTRSCRPTMHIHFYILMIQQVVVLNMNKVHVIENLFPVIQVLVVVNLTLPHTIWKCHKLKMFDDSRFLARFIIQYKCFQIVNFYTHLIQNVSHCVLLFCQTGAYKYLPWNTVLKFSIHTIHVS